MCLFLVFELVPLLNTESSFLMCVCVCLIIIIIYLVSNLVNCHLIDERCQKKINVTPGSH